MIWMFKFWVFCCLLVSIVLADDIDADYFFGSSYEALRARDKAIDCNNPVNQLYCKFKCKNDPGVCFEDKCYCVYEPKPNLLKQSALIKNYDYTKRDRLLRYNPHRRHHIAHFCPNLDEARKCIRKCMTQGKPAFCGKDHVCYCGHKYSHHQKEEELDPEKIKAGFYELYEKYFGPDTTIMKHESKEHNDENIDHNAPPKEDLSKEEGKSHEEGDDAVNHEDGNEDGDDTTNDTGDDEGNEAGDEAGGEAGDEGGDETGDEAGDEGGDEGGAEGGDGDNDGNGDDNDKKNTEPAEEEGNEKTAAEDSDKTADGAATEDKNQNADASAKRKHLRRKVYKFSL